MLIYLKNEITMLRISIAEVQELIDLHFNNNRHVSTDVEHLFKIQLMLYSQLRELFMQVADDCEPMIEVFDKALYNYRLSWLLYLNDISVKP
ncbi:hypothetical protein D0C36_18500 [Mucilaginibacter conchicola]|uniref:Uncharacterized protein n=1 Tax=Mucilaginibacter conchicola TaxID=2303333 RepID=A0A372NQP5_9SPHI|nr:hypothetical protein [Mucilaginibacter conchicola]RFZ90937.1 hypothetical protein D0C36_18500 [Mucilaginibacter conchicola]